MSTIQESTEVDVPVKVAYNQWTQFEEFPRFMDGVASVEQITDTKLHWKVSFSGSEHEWDAEITEQTPDQRVAWRDVEGKTNAGVVTFHRIDDGHTRVSVQMDWEPEGAREKVGDKLGFDDRRLRGDLARFKDFIEAQDRETGAWRGEVEQSTEH